MAAVADISFSEKLQDVSGKLSKAVALVGGMLPGGAFQVQTANVRGVPMKTWKSMTPSLASTYLACMRKFSKKDFIVFDLERYTYGQAQEIMCALAAELASSFGVKHGDKVGIAMRNLPEYMFAFLGITYLGAVAVPLNSLWKSEEFEYAVKDSDLKVLIADASRLSLCAPFLQGSGIKTILCRGSVETAAEHEAAMWADVITRGKGQPAPSFSHINFEDEAMIMYTSGSTGFPKGVVHTQRSVGACIKLGEFIGSLKPDPDAKILMVLPLFHVSALGNTFLFSLPVGSTLVMMNKWDPAEALRLVKEEKISKFTAVPTMLRDVLEHPNFTSSAFASMKSIGSGGAPVPPSLLAQLRKKSKGAEGMQGYGLTETMGAVVVNSGVDYLKHPSSCGKPIPLMVEAVVMDETGKKLGPGQRGELCIRSHFNMKCYHNKPEETKKVVDSEGFFHTGDVAKIEGGFVYILDRLKDLIIRGGENIDCSEIEAVLYSHPAVRECSVFGLPDKRLGEVVGVAVYPQASVSAAELSAFAASGKLANFKVPSQEHIFLLEEPLPKGATGKIDKKGLRESFKGATGGPPASRL